MTEQERILPPENTVHFTLEPGEQLDISLTADGLVTLYLRPRAQPRAESAEAKAAAAASVPTGASAPEPIAPAPPSSESATPTEQPRTTIRGIVGRPPAFWTTKRGVQVGHFPLARHEGTATTWLHALVFYNPTEPDEAKRERARKLITQVRDTVTTGQEVTAIGYPHQREVTQRSGTKTTEEQLYLSAVRQHKTGDTPASSPSPTLESSQP